MKIPTVFLILLGYLFLALAVPVADAHPPLDVIVSIPPQQWLVDRIGGNAVHSEILVTAGQDPHSFEPRPRQIAYLAKARLYFTIGLPFEEALREKIVDAQMPVRFVDCAAGVTKIPFGRYEAGHGDGDDDPHVWLSLAGLAVMAKNIAEALAAADPANSRLYAENLAQLQKELIALDERIAARLKPFAGAVFYTFHPSFGYFAHDYGLIQEAVEIEGKSPTPKQLQHLIAAARKDGARVIFSQPQFDPKSAEAVARAIGGQVIPLDPLAYDAAANLNLIADNIAAALSGRHE